MKKDRQLEEAQKVLTGQPANVQSWIKILLQARS